MDGNLIRYFDFYPNIFVNRSREMFNDVHADDDYGTGPTKAELQTFCETAGLTRKSIPPIVTFTIIDLIERYGDDGMGDKPPEISRITYWAQHINLDKFQKEQEAATEAEAKRQAKRQAKAKAKASSAGSAGDGA